MDQLEEKKYNFKDKWSNCNQRCVKLIENFELI